MASFFFILSLVLSACENDQVQLTPVNINGATMGTTYRLTVLLNESQMTRSVEKLRGEVDAELALINRQMSTYIGSSELMVLNAKPVGEWIQVSDDLFNILVLSARINDLTGGAFDITIGPLVELWGFGATQQEDRVPNAEVITRQKLLTGFKHLEFDVSRNAVYKKQDIQLDLSAIAKGHGADRVASVLDANQINDYLVEIGGEIRLKGNSPRGTPWRIGIETPTLMQGNTQRAISVIDKGVATSGDYRNFFELDGKRYSHTIDPRTGWPVDHQLASVTVIASSTAEADALATGFTVLGAEKAKVVADEHGVAAFFVQRDGDTFVESHSAEFEQYLK